MPSLSLTFVEVTSSWTGGTPVRPVCVGPVRRRGSVRSVRVSLIADSFSAEGWCQWSGVRGRLPREGKTQFRTVRDRGRGWGRSCRHGSGCRGRRGIWGLEEWTCSYTTPSGRSSESPALKIRLRNSFSPCTGPSLDCLHRSFPSGLRVLGAANPRTNRLLSTPVEDDSVLSIRRGPSVPDNPAPEWVGLL